MLPYFIAAAVGFGLAKLTESSSSSDTYQVVYLRGASEKHEGFHTEELAREVYKQRSQTDKYVSLKKKVGNDFIEIDYNAGV